MNILKKIRNKIVYLFLSVIRPEIIGGYRNSDGKYCHNTGISNLTHISNKNNNLRIGDNVFIGHFNYIDGYNAKVTICNNVQITNYVNILTHSSHNSIRFDNKELVMDETYSDLLKVGEIYIGENTYIGPHSVIMPGTKIGKGCVVSAYSYLRGSYPNFSIIRGMPAKVIGDTRNIDEGIIKKYPELETKYYLNNEVDKITKRNKFTAR